MPTEILMPALSPTMTEGKLSKWLVKEGDDVRAGDLIAEIETDKATMEVEAVDEGKVGKIVIAEGTDAVSVNSVIAVLVGDGETVSEEAQVRQQVEPEKAVKPISPPANPTASLSTSTSEQMDAEEAQAYASTKTLIDC